MDHTIQLNMVIAELEQKKRLSRRRYVLYENKVAVELKTPNETSKYEVDIMDTGDTLHYHAENTKGGYTILAILLLIPVIATIIYFVNQGVNSGQVAACWFCFVLILFLAYVKEPVDNVYLSGGKSNLLFFRTAPSEQTVLDFIELVKRAKKNLLKKEFLEFDDDTDEETYHSKLKWLKQQDIITGEEYEEAKLDFKIKRLLQ